MDAERFLTFLKTLRDGRNARLLESIEKGFRHVFEGDCYGSIYAHQISRVSTPKGEIVGNVMAGPSDMITEDAETSKKAQERGVKRDESPKKRMKNVMDGQINV
jgi:hypothetical protein